MLNVSVIRLIYKAIYLLSKKKKNVYRIKPAPVKLILLKNYFSCFVPHTNLG